MQLFVNILKLATHNPSFLPISVAAEMTGEVHICSLQVLVGVQIEAMIYDMCCKQSLCISQGPVTAPAQAVKASALFNPPFRLQFSYRRLKKKTDFCMFIIRIHLI